METASVTNSIEVSSREVRVDLSAAHDQPWRAQISHAVTVIGGREYTPCYRAKAAGERFITAYMDTNMFTWANVSGGQFRADLTRSYQDFKHTFTVSETDLMSRVAFDFAQSDIDVQIDDIGVYEARSAGHPSGVAHVVRRRQCISVSLWYAVSRSPRQKTEEVMFIRSVGGTVRQNPPKGLSMVLVALLALQVSGVGAAERNLLPNVHDVFGPTWNSSTSLAFVGASMCCTRTRSHCLMGFKSASSTWARAT